MHVGLSKACRHTERGSRGTWGVSIASNQRSKRTRDERAPGVPLTPPGPGPIYIHIERERLSRFVRDGVGVIFLVGFRFSVFARVPK